MDDHGNTATLPAGNTLDLSEGSPGRRGGQGLAAGGELSSENEGVWHPDQEWTEAPESHPLDLQSRFQALIHQRVADHRRLIIDALWEDAADAVLRKRARQLGWCGSHPSIRACGAKPAANLARCRDRVCPTCARLRGIQAAARCRSIVQTFNTARFITLTLKHRQEPLADTLDRLLDCIRRLRAEKCWKANVAGGVQAIEVTYRRNTEMWHVHAHLIVSGRFLPQPQLKAAWLKVTGDSDIVHIRAINDRGNAIDYVTKYVGKPLDPQTWPPAKLREYAHAFKGRRLLQPFGTALKVHLDDDDEPALAADTSHLCTAHQLHAAAEAGIPRAQRAIEVLACCGASFAAMMLLPFDAANPPADPTAEELAEAIAVARIVGVTPLEQLKDKLCQPTATPASVPDSSCSDSAAASALLFERQPGHPGREA